MASKLPTAIQIFRTAVNASDTAGFIALFAEDGVVEDWGRRFAGHQAILAWSAKELIGAKGTLSYGAVIESNNDRVRLQTQWTSSVFTGAAVFTFVLAGTLIASLTISEH